MIVSTPFNNTGASQTLSLEAIFRHTPARPQNIESNCDDGSYWSGCMALDEIACGTITPSLRHAAALIQSHHGLSYGA